ncbi:hypothetical protein [Chlorogloea sp. CCALA 695]|uniref:hypothetical protein n=1 Tax=Chlorogloea sp. CCALA 695 TaxID=2107693 RepID=UPI000D04C17B|nr:hypothetical protein [Chlorogloea sp. CCALA 695]PSB32020.1 hypothetical protein C7B70_11780 [Chlorogloea sp. CCALA 695]
MIDNSKKILTGTLSFFVGLLAGKKAQTDKQVKPSVAKPKKRSGYFMELDESEDANLLTQPVAAVKQAVEKTKNATVEAAKQVAETVKTSEPVAAAKQSVEKAKTSEPVTAAKQSVEKAKTSESGQKVAATAEPVATKKSKVELVQTAEGLKAEPAKPSISIAASSNGQNKTETTFAPKYLNPANSSTSRRRPGANMTNFLDMANQVKKQAKD